MFLSFFELFVHNFGILIYIKLFYLFKFFIFIIRNLKYLMQYLIIFLKIKIFLSYKYINIKLNMLYAHILV